MFGENTIFKAENKTRVINFLTGISGAVISLVLLINQTSDKLIITLTTIISFACWVYCEAFIRKIKGRNLRYTDRILVLFATITWLDYIINMSWNSISNIVVNHTNISNQMNFAFLMLKVFLMAFTLLAGYQLFIFIYECIIKFIKLLLTITDKIDHVFFVIYVGLATILIMICYLKTKVFWGSDYYNTVFTFDSSPLYTSNVFMNQLSIENDIRQPLFAIYSLPVSVPAYLLSKIITINNSYAFFLQISNVILIAITGTLLSKLLKLESRAYRIAFYAFYSSTYSTALFNFVIEQYAVLVFYLIFAIYYYENVDKNKNRTVEYIIEVGAVGTLLTNGLIVIKRIFDIHNFKGMVKYIVKIVSIFLGLCFCFGKSLTIIYAITGINKLLFFSGTKEHVSFVSRIMQFLNFMNNIFKAPALEIGYKNADQVSIYLPKITGISIVGVVILVLILLCLVTVRHEMFLKYCYIWVLFSMVLLIGLGWCSATNDMILYVYYFGWSYIAIVFSVLKKLIKNEKVFFIGCILFSIYMMTINANNILEIIKFGIANYPV